MTTKGIGGRVALLVAMACSSVFGLAACGGGSHSADKAGASVLHPVTLRLEMPDAGDARGTFFAQDVTRRSGGSVRVRTDLTGYSSVLPANELALARALEHGRQQIAYLPARDWAAAGLPAFRALLAPFVITTERASQNLATGQVASQILASLPHSLVGIALVPDEPRRVLANRPLSAPAAFAGMRIRIVDNPQSAVDLAALGARPVQGLNAHQVWDALQHGQIDAVESSPSSILGNAYFNFVRYLSGYSIFPKFQSIVVSRRVWDGLSHSQQSAIRKAAADTVAAAGEQLPAQERGELASLCQSHVEISPATPAELSSFTAAVQPVIASLTKNSTTARALDAMRRVPGAGPQPLASSLPAACRPTGAANPASPAKGSARIPNGVYVVTDTYKDWSAGGVINKDFKTAITYTTTMSNGRWYQTQSPNYPDQGPFSGTYSVRGDKVVFVMLKAGAHGQNSIDAPEVVRWSYFDGQLRFAIVNVTDSGSKVLYTAHPWRKVG
jgi:TRAP-type transport system periplasmic protein